jgi:hypothetical protein
MVYHMTCAVCNSGPGERTRLRFAGADAHEQLSISMCASCFAAFDEDPGVTVSRPED